jgi:hypothetical protein
MQLFTSAISINFDVTYSTSIHSATAVQTERVVEVVFFIRLQRFFLPPVFPLALLIPVQPLVLCMPQLLPTRPLCPLMLQL